MAVLNQSLFQDTDSLIRLYQTMAAFRERFDLAVKRSVNVTYKHRPLKLYFEVLASSNAAKFKEAYQKIRGLVKQDVDGIIKQTLLRVTPKDLHDLSLHAKKAKEENVNTTTYPDKEIEKINKIEESSANPEQKQAAHQKRLEKTTFLAIAKSIPELKETKEIEKESAQPASEEEKVIFLAPLSSHEETITAPEVKEQQFVSEPGPEEPYRSSTPSSPSFGTVSRIRNLFSRGGGAAEKIGARAEAEIVTGKAAVAGAEKLIVKAGVGAAVKAGTIKASGFLVKLGISAVTGVATGGVGFVVNIAAFAVTSLSGQMKQLGKLLLQITIGLACFILFMFFANWGTKMSAWLPPYEVAEAAPPGVSPSPSPSISPPPGADTVSCPLIPHNTISCGSLGTNYGSCIGGHCGPNYPTCQDSEKARLIHSIDVPAAAGTTVILPTINRSQTTWAYNGFNTFLDEGNGGGVRLSFTASIDGDIWQLYLTHVILPTTSPLVVGNNYQSGGPVATIAKDQIHVNISKNGVWIDPESLGMCI